MALLFGVGTLPTAVQAMEIVLFNCPELGVSVDEIRTSGLGRDSFLQDTRLLTSCDSLVSVCMPVSDITPNFVNVEFLQRPGAQWIHLAEMKFIERGSTNSSCQGGTSTVVPSPSPPSPPTFSPPVFSTPPPASQTPGTVETTLRLTSGQRRTELPSLSDRQDNDYPQTGCNFNIMCPLFRGYIMKGLVKGQTFCHYRGRCMVQL